MVTMLAHFYQNCQHYIGQEGCEPDEIFVLFLSTQKMGFVTIFSGQWHATTSHNQMSTVNYTQCLWTDGDSTVQRRQEQHRDMCPYWHTDTTLTTSIREHKDIHILHKCHKLLPKQRASTVSCNNRCNLKKFSHYLEVSLSLPDGNTELYFSTLSRLLVNLCCFGFSINQLFH